MQDETMLGTIEQQLDTAAEDNPQFAELNSPGKAAEEYLKDATEEQLALQLDQATQDPRLVLVCIMFDQPVFSAMEGPVPPAVDVSDLRTREVRGHTIVVHPAYGNRIEAGMIGHWRHTNIYDWVCTPFSNNADRPGRIFVRTKTQLVCPNCNFTREVHRREAAKVLKQRRMPRCPECAKGGYDVTMQICPFRPNMGRVTPTIRNLMAAKAKSHASDYWPSILPRVYGVYTEEKVDACKEIWPDWNPAEALNDPEEAAVADWFYAKTPGHGLILPYHHAMAIREHIVPKHFVMSAAPVKCGWVPYVQMHPVLSPMARMGYDMQNETPLRRNWSLGMVIDRHISVPGRRRK